MSNLTKFDQVKTDLSKLQDRFSGMVGRDTWEKEKSFALQLFRRNSFILECTPESILEAVMNVANVGLTLNPAAKMAYLVPRYQNKQNICVLEPSYQGLVKLITDTGTVTSVESHVVYRGDLFNVSLGDTPSVEHKPTFESDDIIAVYAIARLREGGYMVEVMRNSEIESIRELSESYKAFKDGKIKSSTWDAHFGEMARKTVIRRLTKYLPKSSGDWTLVQKAVELDESDFKPSGDAMDYAESLMMTCSLSPERLQHYQRYMSSFDRYEFEDMMKAIQENQIDAISAGHNYQQGDITKKLEREI